MERSVAAGEGAAAPCRAGSVAENLSFWLTFPLNLYCVRLLILCLCPCGFPLSTDGPLRERLADCPQTPDLRPQDDPTLTPRIACWAMTFTSGSAESRDHLQGELPVDLGRVNLGHRRQGVTQEGAGCVDAQLGPHARRREVA